MSNFHVLDNKYLLISELGRGVSGVVYHAKSLETGEIVVVKVEDLEGFNIEREASVYELVHANRCDAPQYGIPRLIAHGRDSQSGKPYLVLPDLGISLESFLREGPLSVAIIRQIAVQLIETLRDLHVRCKLVYRDLKPANVMIEEVLAPGEHAVSSSASSALREVRVWLIDLGLTRPHTHLRGDASAGARRPLVGNARFASVAAHHGCMCVTRPIDDLESLGYLLSFLAHRSLPWIRPEFATYTAADKEKLFDAIFSIKRGASVEDLCPSGRSPLPELAYFLTYVFERSSSGGGGGGGGHCRSSNLDACRTRAKEAEDDRKDVPAASVDYSFLARLFSAADRYGEGDAGGAVGGPALRIGMDSAASADLTAADVCGRGSGAGSCSVALGPPGHKPPAGRASAPPAPSASASRGEVAANLSAAAATIRAQARAVAASGRRAATAAAASAAPRRVAPLQGQARTGGEEGEGEGEGEGKVEGKAENEKENEEQDAWGSRRMRRTAHPLSSAAAAPASATLPAAARAAERAAPPAAAVVAAARLRPGLGLCALAARPSTAPTPSWLASPSVNPSVSPSVTPVASASASGSVAASSSPSFASATVSPSPSSSSSAPWVLAPASASASAADLRSTSTLASAAVAPTASGVAPASASASPSAAACASEAAAVAAAALSAAEVARRSGIRGVGLAPRARFSRIAAGGAARARALAAFAENEKTPPSAAVSAAASPPAPAPAQRAQSFACEAAAREPADAPAAPLGRPSCAPQSPSARGPFPAASAAGAGASAGAAGHGSLLASAAPAAAAGAGAGAPSRGAPTESLARSPLWTRPSAPASAHIQHLQQQRLRPPLQPLSAADVLNVSSDRVRAVLGAGEAASSGCGAAAQPPREEHAQSAPKAPAEEAAAAALPASPSARATEQRGSWPWAHAKRLAPLAPAPAPSPATPQSTGGGCVRWTPASWTGSALAPASPSLLPCSPTAYASSTSPTCAAAASPCTLSSPPPPPRAALALPQPQIHPQQQQQQQHRRCASVRGHANDRRLFGASAGNPQTTHPPVQRPAASQSVQCSSPVQLHFMF